ncbi:MAG: hypothetical protein JNL73_24815 [Anaerolineales bacterium]|nr:hypothetical protein [Anaerolineales bacterium]
MPKVTEVSTHKARLLRRTEEGDDRFLSTLQIGITLVGIPAERLEAP